MSNPTQVTYKTALDVLDRHGLIVFVLYWTTELFSHFSVGFCLRDLPRRVRNIDGTYDAALDRVKPWWQDIVFLVTLVLLTPLAVSTAWSPSLQAGGIFLSAYLIFDAAIYFVRVLWFDDLRPGRPNRERGVSSHRRILFIAVLSFCQTVLLFPGFYHWEPQFSSNGFLSLLARSFCNATLLSPGQPLTALDVVQVSLSLFYLAVVITAMVAMSYRRDEFSEEHSEG